jgi:hypothetical protein
MSQCGIAWLGEKRLARLAIYKQGRRRLALPVTGAKEKKRVDIDVLKWCELCASWRNSTPGGSVSR